MKLGLAGYGRWGANVARALARVGTLSVICDTHVGRQEDATRDWSPWGTRVTGHPEDLAACDAVWVATPTADHEHTVRFLLDEGKHVMVEKPVVRDLNVALDLVDIARSKGLLLMGGFLGIHTGCHRELKTLLPPRDLDVVRRNTQASLSDGDVLWGLGPHDVASALDLIRLTPNSVTAAGNTHRVVVQMTWDEYDPAHVSIELDWLAEEKRRAVFRNGDRSINYAESANPVEPLLREAQHFVGIISDDQESGREEEHRRILAVTDVLARAHACLQ